MQNGAGIHREKKLAAVGKASGERYFTIQLRYKLYPTRINSNLLTAPHRPATKVLNITIESIHQDLLLGVVDVMQGTACAHQIKPSPTPDIPPIPFFSTRTVPLRGICQIFLSRFLPCGRPSKLQKEAPT